MAQFDHGQSPASRTVYVVDDDTLVRRSIGFLLSSAAFAVHPFASGSDFLESIDELASGCVVLDIRMPEMDGLQVLEALGHRRIRFPVIAMTGHGDIEIAVRAMKLGASDFLEKPFADALLQGMLASLFDGLPSAVQLEREREAARRQIAELSARELDVLRGMVSGVQNKVLAHDLGLSVRTVEMHRSNMLARLQTPSSASALRMAFLADIQPD